MRSMSDFHDLMFRDILPCLYFHIPLDFFNPFDHSLFNRDRLALNRKPIPHIDNIRSLTSNIYDQVIVFHITKP